MKTLERAAATTLYPVHTIESAPEGAREALRGLQSAVGLIPNLAATMATAPGLLKGFLALRALYTEGSFSGADIQVLSIVAATENDCAWCVAFHTAMGLKEGLPREAVDALRAGRAPADPRWAALSAFSRAMVRGRGNVGPDGLETFLAAGFTREQALEVVLGMAFSLLANYAHHLTQAPLDAFLVPHTWTHA